MPYFFNIVADIFIKKNLKGSFQNINYYRITHYFFLFLSKSV